MADEGMVQWSGADSSATVGRMRRVASPRLRGGVQGGKGEWGGVGGGGGMGDGEMGAREDGGKTDGWGGGNGKGWRGGGRMEDRCEGA